MASGYYTGPDNYYDNRRWLLNWEFNWLGFKAQGYELSRYGWSAFSLRSERTFADAIILEHKEQGVQFMSQWIDDYSHKEMRNEMLKGMPLCIAMKHCARDIRMHVAGTFNYRMDALDLDPREVSYKEIAIGDLLPKLIREPEQRIIVPKDPTVYELLQQIIAKQQPGQVEYFNNKVKNREVPEATMMGQIIKLRA